MNFILVWISFTDRQTRQTDRKWCLWAHCATCTGGLKNIKLILHLNITHHVHCVLMSYKRCDGVLLNKMSRKISIFGWHFENLLPVSFLLFSIGLEKLSNNIISKQNKATWRWREPTCLFFYIKWPWHLTLDLDLLWPLTLTHLTFDILIKSMHK